MRSLIHPTSVYMWCCYIQHILRVSRAYNLLITLIHMHTTRATRAAICMPDSIASGATRGAA